MNVAVIAASDTDEDGFDKFNRPDINPFIKTIVNLLWRINRIILKMEKNVIFSPLF